MTAVQTSLAFGKLSDEHQMAVKRAATRNLHNGGMELTGDARAAAMEASLCYRSTGKLRPILLKMLNGQPC